MKYVCSNKRSLRGNTRAAGWMQKLVLDGIFTALLVLFGMLKLPSLIPGAEFQLSAPYAVCLVSLTGFKRYFGIGIGASGIQLLLGTHTILNVVTAMVFRIVAGCIVTWCPMRKAAVWIAGPIGTGCARIVLAVMLHVPVWPLLVAAVPGMIFTAICAAVVNPVLRKILIQSGLPLYE